MRVIFACAGTGGHINPAIAIANIILQKEPDSKFLFVGTKDGIENELVTKAGYEIKQIRTGKIIRSITLKNFSAIINTVKGMGDANKLVKEFKPDVVIGTGGYICVPVMHASKKYKIPYILHESNAFPGVSVKLYAKNAVTVMVGFKDAKSRLKNGKNVVYTGTPARFTKENIQILNRDKCRTKLKLNNISKKIILVTGGSQGAKRFNQVILDMVKTYLSDDIYIVLVTGNKNYDEILNLKREIEKEKNIKLDKYIKIEKFVHNMDEMYKAVDMCITRAGAMTITELEIAGKPSILIPLPTAAENHQFYNAKVLANSHAGIIIEQKDLTLKLLYDKINYMINDKNLKMMSDNALKLVTNGVEEKIYKCIKDAVKK